MGSGKSTQAIQSSGVIVRPVLEEVAGEAEVSGTMAHSAPLCCHDVWLAGRVRILALQYDLPPYTPHLNPYMLALPHLRSASVKRPFRGGTYTLPGSSPSLPSSFVYLHRSFPFLLPTLVHSPVAGMPLTHPNAHFQDATLSPYTSVTEN